MIEEKFVGIEAMSLVGIVWAVDPVSVNQARARLGQIAVPDLIGLLLDSDTVQFPAACRVEEAELYTFCMFRKKGEVDAFAVPCGSQRIRPSGPHDRLSLNDHSVLDLACIGKPRCISDLKPRAGGRILPSQENVFLKMNLKKGKLLK